MNLGLGERINNGVRGAVGLQRIIIHNGWNKVCMEVKGNITLGMAFSLDSIL